MQLRKKKYFQSRITGIDDDIRDISREIRQLKKIMRKEERLSGITVRGEVDESAKKEEQEAGNSRKLASYLSTGSFQTISRHKFQSDLVRKQRLMIGGGIIILIAAILILWHYLG